LEATLQHILVVRVYSGGMQTNLFDEKPPANYSGYLNPNFVTQKVISNLKQEKPVEELIVRRPTA